MVVIGAPGILAETCHCLARMFMVFAQLPLIFFVVCLGTVTGLQAEVRSIAVNGKVVLLYGRSDSYITIETEGKRVRRIFDTDTYRIDGVPVSIGSAPVNSVVSDLESQDVPQREVLWKHYEVLVGSIAAGLRDSTQITGQEYVISSGRQWLTWRISFPRRQQSNSQFGDTYFFATTVVDSMVFDITWGTPKHGSESRSRELLGQAMGSLRVRSMPVNFAVLRDSLMKAR